MNAVITNPINLVILIIGTFLGLSLSLFLLLNKSVKNKANLYLGALVFVFTLFFLTGFLFRFNLLEQFPHIIGVQQLASFLVGPFAYLYVRACTQHGFQFKPIFLLHFLPFVVDVLFFLPVLTQTGQAKIDLYFNLIDRGILLQSYWMLTAKSMQVSVYFVLSIMVISTYKKHLTNMASSIDKNFHRWLLIFITIVSLPIIGLIGFVFTDFYRPLVQISALCLFSFILAVYIATLVKPELFHAFPHQMPLPESTEVKKQKYESSKLQDDKKDEYLKKLKAFVEHERPFQSPDLTLAQLSEKVKIPAHYLSQVINEKLDTNFLDFINGYRVKAAQEMLVDPKLSHYTILSTAYEAGFSAKSTFYAVFKKQTGMTPSQYRKQAKTAA